ncbi:hypothetical protein ACS0TY_022343 [Phlomoides rotata]
MIHIKRDFKLLFYTFICLYDRTRHNSEVFMIAFRRGACHVAQAGELLVKKGCAGDGWGHIFDVLQSPCASFSSFKIENWTEKNIIDLPDMKSTLVSNAKQIVDRLQRVRHFGPWDRGSKT